MRHSETCPTAIPGVVDGALTICPEADDCVSFHIVFGSADAAGRQVHIEFVLHSQYVPLVRAALTSGSEQDVAEDALSSVPCHVGVLISR